MPNNDMILYSKANDPSSDEEAASTDDESDPEDPTVAWCPPIPDAAEDPSEDEIASAADKLAILISNVQPNGNPFCIPETLELSHRYGYRQD